MDLPVQGKNFIRIRLMSVSYKMKDLTWQHMTLPSDTFNIL